MKRVSPYPMRVCTDEYREAQTKVLAIAAQYAAGEITLAEARGQCSDRERNIALTSCPLTVDEKALLYRWHPRNKDEPLVESGLIADLIAQDDAITMAAIEGAGGVMTKHGWISHAEIVQQDVKAEYVGGRLVLTWPLYQSPDGPLYPPEKIPPGEEKRRRIEGMEAGYRKRKQKHGGRGNGA